MTEDQALQSSNPIFKSLEMMLYWASAKIDRDRLDLWPVELSEVVLYWVTVSSEQAISRFAQGCATALQGDGPAHLIAIGQPYGESATRALATVVKCLRGVRSSTEAIERLKQWRLEMNEQSGLLTKLSLTQRVLGRAIVDRSLELKGAIELKRAQAGEDRGYLALPLIGANLNRYERVCFASLVIDALATLHEERLEPTEGFVPERLVITHRFDLVAPRSRPTQLKPLLGPEAKRGEPLDSASDVWSVARLALSLFTGKPLATPPERLLVELPADVSAPLKRALHLKREARFFSGRELRVVLSTPLEKWIEQLTYESKQEEDLKGDQSPLTDQNELEAELILPYEDYAVQQEREREERVQKRRSEELKLRKRQRNKMRMRQLFGLIVFGLISSAVYGAYVWHQGVLQAEIERSTEEALARRERFAQRDHDRQEDLPQDLKDLGFRWRWLSTSPQGILISVAEVTKAQYQVCVDAGKCTLVEATKTCELDMTTELELPMTCISYYEADDFASFVGGRLPHLDEWQFAANIEHYNEFPWGEQPPREERANLFYERDGADPKLVESCRYPLGDSPHALCDLTGNVHEWVERQRAPRFGIVGGGWLTPPSEKFMRFRSISGSRRGEDLGFRVVVDLSKRDLEP